MTITAYLKRLGVCVLILVVLPTILATLTIPFIGPFAVVLAWAYFCIPPFFVLRVLLSMSVLQHEFLMPQSGFEMFLVVLVWALLCALVAFVFSIRLKGEKS